MVVGSLPFSCTTILISLGRSVWNIATTFLIIFSLEIILAQTIFLLRKQSIAGESFDLALQESASDGTNIFFLLSLQFMGVATCKVKGCFHKH